MRKQADKKQAKTRRDIQMPNGLRRQNGKLTISQPASLKKEDLKANSDQVLKIVAHDLRNPISGILAASQYLLEDAGQQLEGHHLALLQSIELSSGFALRFIEDTLELLSIQSQNLALRFQSTDIVRLVNEIAAIHQPFAGSKRIRLEVNSQGAVPPLRLDSTRMTQAIGVLLTNALKYSHPESRVEVLVAAREAGVTITVHDEPAPLAEGMKPLLATIRKAHSKNGLNEARRILTLTAVRRVVEGHHGAIAMKNGSEKGCTYTITLPIPNSASAARKSSRNAGQQKFFGADPDGSARTVSSIR
jgi:K+-sensing histidine kinase KdpD